MLKYEVVNPEESVAGAPLVILLHGRGADGQDLQGLARALPAGSTLVTPRAPFPGVDWGYGPGWAWYRYLEEDRVDMATLEESLSRLRNFLQRIRGELDHEDGPLVLGGFSQGGTTSMAYALRHPGEAPAVVNLSGFLVSGEPVVVSEETVADTAFFWGHGLHDPAIPHRLAVRGRERLSLVGARLTARDYRIQHSISPEEMRDVRLWIEEVRESSRFSHSRGGAGRSPEAPPR